MQAEKLSSNAKVSYIFNEKEIFEGPVGFTLVVVVVVAFSSYIALDPH